MLLIRNVLKPFAKSVLKLLGLIVATSAIDAAIQEHVWIRCNNINNFEWRNEWYYEIVKSLEESGLFIKDISEIIENEGKEQKWGFLGMLLGILGASLLRNLLASKATIRTNEGTIRAG